MKPGLLRPSLVEPLSRPAWERVETRLFERLGRGEHLPAQNISVRGPAPVRVWLGAAALVLTGTVLLWLVLDTLHHGAAPSSSAQLAHAPLVPPVVAPQLEPHGTAPARSNAAPAARIDSESTRIVTTSAPTRTLLGEAALTLAANSDVRVQGTDEHGWLVELESGEVDCEVGPRRGRPPFVVQVGETRVSVVGTRFSVARDGSSARVRVLEGHVQVESGKSVRLLGPGDRWPAGAAAEPEKQLGARAKARSARSPDPARARFERATRLEASDPDGAARIYAELAKSRGPWAANALYAQARLESERGHGERARRLFERYLELYPKGVNAPDVRALQSRY